MIRYAHIDEARRAVPRWGGDPSTVEHLGDRGNSVFSFKNANSQLQILRFTDKDFRSFDELNAELHFVNHLHDAGVPVARGLQANNGELSFWFPCASGELICSSISYAPGLEVLDDSPHWGATFFQEWGRNLGLIHQAAADFRPSADQPHRWQWDKEILIAQAEKLIPAEDTKSREEFCEVLNFCHSLEKSPADFGLIHADHAPQNFRFEPESKRITAFDFGNCCYHWFLSDLAISLSTVRRKENRETIRESILEGYSEIRALPHNHAELIDLFIRLRVVYVYLSRLHLWSVNRTPEQAKDLEIFKERVHAKTGW